MKLLSMILGLTLVSCGSSSDNGDSSSQEASTGVATSYYVASASKLVECNDKTRGYLAYVQDAQEFQACLSSGWSKVDVKGKDGSAGSNGSNGSSGTNTMVSGNQWYDAVASKMWVMTNINTSVTGFTDSQTSCGGAYRIPSYTEAQTALAHGMGVMAQAMASAPTYIMTSGVSATGKVVRISDQNYMVPASGSAAQFCIAQ